MAFAVAMEARMKSLSRKLKGALSVGMLSTIGIAMEWSQALGQSTPDTINLVPEPASIGLFVTGIAGFILVRHLRKK